MRWRGGRRGEEVSARRRIGGEERSSPPLRRRRGGDGPSRARPRRIPAKYTRRPPSGSMRIRPTALRSRSAGGGRARTARCKRPPRPSPVCASRGAEEANTSCRTTLPSLPGSGTGIARPTPTKKIRAGHRIMASPPPAPGWKLSQRNQPLRESPSFMSQRSRVRSRFGMVLSSRTQRWDWLGGRPSPRSARDGT